MKVIRIKIFSKDDRDNIVKALANNGVKVWIEIEEENAFHPKYFVCFELPESTKEQS